MGVLGIESTSLANDSRVAASGGSQVVRGTGRIVNPNALSLERNAQIGNRTSIGKVSANTNSKTNTTTKIAKGATVIYGDPAVNASLGASLDALNKSQDTNSSLSRALEVIGAAKADTVTPNTPLSTVINLQPDNGGAKSARSITDAIEQMSKGNVPEKSGFLSSLSQSTKQLLTGITASLLAGALIWFFFRRKKS